MKYMYTNKPDDSCHEIHGTHGRPVNTYEQVKLKAKGWTFKPGAVEEKAPVKELSITDQAKALGIKTKDENGKTIHYKLLAKEIEAHDGGTNEG